MKIKSFFSACLLALLFLSASPEVQTSIVSTASIFQQCNDEYVYIKVNVDGVIWIEVYDSKGNFIMTYPEE